MSEIIIGCSYTYGVALEMDCEESPAWKLIFLCDDGETRTLISCDYHLADLARGIDSDYGALSIELQELPI